MARDWFDLVVTVLVVVDAMLIAYQLDRVVFRR